MDDDPAEYDESRARFEELKRQAAIDDQEETQTGENDAEPILPVVDVEAENRAAEDR